MLLESSIGFVKNDPCCKPMELTLFLSNAISACTPAAWVPCVSIVTSAVCHSDEVLFLSGTSKICKVILPFCRVLIACIVFDFSGITGFLYISRKTAAQIIRLIKRTKKIPDRGKCEPVSGTLFGCILLFLSILFISCNH